MTTPNEAAGAGRAASDRTWTVGYRVRFDEAGPDGLVRPGILLAYAQDCAWIHSTRLGFDRAWYANRGLVWLVRAVRLQLLTLIPSGSDLAVRTEVVGFRAASARRRTEISLDGAPVAFVDTDWAMTDPNGRPARVPAELLERFTAAGGSSDPSFAPIRVRPAMSPPEKRAEEAEESAVEPGEVVLHEAIRRSDADPMAHLNNGRALDLVEEALVAIPEGRDVLRAVPRRYLLEYRAPLPVSRRILLAVRSASPGPGCWVELRDVAVGQVAVAALVTGQAGSV